MLIYIVLHSTKFEQKATSEVKSRVHLRCHRRRHSRCQFAFRHYSPAFSCHAGCSFATVHTLLWIHPHHQTTTPECLLRTQRRFTLCCGAQHHLTPAMGSLPSWCYWCWRWEPLYVPDGIHGAFCGRLRARRPNRHGSRSSHLKQCRLHRTVCGCEV